METGPLFEIDARTVFSNSWFVVGHESEVPMPGHFKTFRILEHSILMVRDSQRVRAFFNSCAHRNSELVSGQGLLRDCHITCPLHGWTYRLDGASDRGGRLRELPVENFHGFIFLSLNDNSSFDEFYARGLVEGLFSKRRPSRTCGSRVETNLDASWDSYVELHLDYEHIASIHRNFGDLMGDGINYEYERNIAVFEYDPVTARTQAIPRLMRFLSRRKVSSVMEFYFYPSSFIEFYDEMSLYYSYVPSDHSESSNLLLGFQDNSDRLSLRGKLQKALFKFVQNQGFHEDHEAVRRVQFGRKSFSQVGELLGEPDEGISRFRTAIRADFGRSR